jgi:predicted RNase H-like HicB family nuclease
LTGFRVTNAKRFRDPMEKDLVMIEKGDSSYGAYVPDLPGCVAVGETEEEVLNLIHDAIEFHLDGLHEEGASTSSFRL